MVNNNVLRMCGYDPDEVQAFAFGIGIEMYYDVCWYGIDDIVISILMIDNLRQFKEAK